VSDGENPPARRVRRGEGEVTQWPRGLAGYVPSEVPDGTPDPEEDRVRNRLLLAARLVGVLRAGGAPVETEVVRLRAAEATLRAGDRARAAAEVDRLLGDLDRRLPRRGAAPVVSP